MRKVYNTVRVKLPEVGGIFYSRSAGKFVNKGIVRCSKFPNCIEADQCTGFKAKTQDGHTEVSAFCILTRWGDGL